MEPHSGPSHMADSMANLRLTRPVSVNNFLCTATVSQRIMPRILRNHSMPSAKEGIWELKKDEAGKTYWANHSLRATAWEPPKGSACLCVVAGVESLCVW
jgi:hypothetical protein